MPSTDSQPKVCIRCGQDCSNKRRAKDAHGRYVCAQCMTQTKPEKGTDSSVARAKPSVNGSGGSGGGARPAVSKPVQTAIPEDHGILGKLIDQSIEEHRYGCPNCHAPMKSAQILCIKCGFNKERGKQVQTVVKKSAEEKGIDASPQNEKIRKLKKLMQVGGLAISLIAIGVIIFWLYFQA
jgi:hypothetical protein